MIVGAPIYSSSHITADLCSQLLLKHHVSFIQARYMKRISASKNEVIKMCWPYLKTGYLSESLTTCFIELYECDLWTNDLDVLRARIKWVQKHEIRRGVCHFYNL